VRSGRPQSDATKSTRSPYFTDNREYIGRVLIRQGLDGRNSALAGLCELRVTQRNPTLFGSRERRLRPMANHRPLFLSKRCEQVQNEWVYVGTKLCDDEGDAVSHQAADEVNVAAEAARDMARQIAKSREGQTSRRLRKKVEMLFAHLKRILKLDWLRLRGPNGARDEFLLAATNQTS
jgi:Transposase DDE domain